MKSIQEALSKICEQEQKPTRCDLFVMDLDENLTPGRFWTNWGPHKDIIEVVYFDDAGLLTDSGFTVIFNKDTSEIEYTEQDSNGTKQTWYLENTQEFIDQFSRNNPEFVFNNLKGEPEEPDVEFDWLNEDSNEKKSYDYKGYKINYDPEKDFNNGWYIHEPYHYQIWKDDQHVETCRSEEECKKYIDDIVKRLSKLSRQSDVSFGDIDESPEDIYYVSESSYAYKDMNTGDIKGKISYTRDYDYAKKLWINDSEVERLTELNPFIKVKLIPEVDPESPDAYDARGRYRHYNGEMKVYLYVDKNIENSSKREYDLVGVDGNAYSVMAYVTRALKQERLQHLVKEYQDKAMSGDYDNLLVVSMEYIDKANEASKKNATLDVED